jgi:hypothetical protein
LWAGYHKNVLTNSTLKDNEMSIRNPSYAEPASPLPPVQPCPALNYYHDLNLDVAPGLKPMADFMADTLAAQKALSDERQKVDTRMTRDANLDRIEQSADKLNDLTGKRYVKVDAAIRYEAAQAEEELASKTHIKPSAEAGEIRGVIRGMNDADRSALVRKAFADNDTTLIAAIVGMHKVVTGIDPELLADEHDRWKARTAPAQYAAVKEYHKALGYHDATAKGLLRWYPKSKAGLPGFEKAESASATILRSYETSLEA